jgi:hypothetical protein
MQTSMSPEFMGHIKEKYNNQKGQDYPSGNQIVRNIIFAYNIDNVVLDYLQKNNAQIVRNSKDRIEAIIKDERWIVLPVKDSIRGYRAYKARIDIRLMEEWVKTSILPVLGLYCCEVDFF